MRRSPLVRLCQTLDAAGRSRQDVVQHAASGEHRDERLTKSLTQIPATLIHLVHTMAIALVLRVTIGLTGVRKRVTLAEDEHRAVV